MIDTAEIKRRNDYWAEHWAEFQCQVQVQIATERTAYAGAEIHGQNLGLFGAYPLPIHSDSRDWGTFAIQNRHLLFSGEMASYAWPMDYTTVSVYEGGATLTAPGQPTIRNVGPVGAPIAGAYRDCGLWEKVYVWQS